MTTSPPRLFVEVSVTYGEMIVELTKLGYRQEFDGKNNRYINEKHNSWVVLPVNSLDTTLERIYVAVISHRLYLQGVIKEEENTLMLMIEKNRLKKNKKSTNVEQASA